MNLSVFRKNPTTIKLYHPSFYYARINLKVAIGYLWEWRTLTESDEKITIILLDWDFKSRFFGNLHFFKIARFSYLTGTILRNQVVMLSACPIRQCCTIWLSWGRLVAHPDLIPNLLHTWRNWIFLCQKHKEDGHITYCIVFQTIENRFFRNKQAVIFSSSEKGDASVHIIVLFSGFVNTSVWSDHIKKHVQ